jgi:neutral ceramidase
MLFRRSMNRRTFVWVGWGLLLLPFVLLTIGLVDWRPELKAARAPLGAFAAKGRLKVGSARMAIVPPGGAPLGGYASREEGPAEGVLHEPAVRAIVVEVGDRRLGLVSLETLVMTAPLREKVVAAASALKLDDILLAATHTHSGPGGFWDSRLAEWMGAGRYDAEVESFLVERSVTTLKLAAGDLRHANVSIGTLDTSKLGANRDSADGAVDTRLTAVRFTDDAERTFARLVLLGIHPTILPDSNRRYSGDWPGSLMRILEADGGTTLFWQGAGGDTTWGKRGGDMAPDARVELFGAAIAAEAKGALALAGNGTDTVVLRHGRARLSLPTATDTALAPRILEPLVDNVLHFLAHPGATEVSWTELGPLKLAAVPAEPVAAVGLAWREKLGATAVAGLVDAYIGYVETAEHVIDEKAEAKRTYFGPTLADDLLGALEAARDAADQEVVIEPVSPEELGAP